jgi:hypothetical protein
MTEIDADAAQAAARNIIEIALKSLTDMGMTYQGASALLVIQGAIRVESGQDREGLVHFLNETLDAWLAEREATAPSLRLVEDDGRTQ